MKEDPMTIGIQIVDDQPDVRVLLRMTIDLANDGLVVVAEAANGEEALGQVDAADPQVVVLDEMMPGMTGIDCARRMLDRRPGQVIVLCSAHLDELVRERARAAGVTRSLPKDRIDELPDLIRELAS
jgi:DNA-binding NarL/FixJ family response regulator